MRDSYAIWLYGSHARGDGDVFSDVDLFVAGVPGTTTEEIQAKVPIPMSTASLSRYSWDEIREMATYGSLFLHHLRLEGYPLYETSSCKGALGLILASLGDYRHVERDLKGFRTVLDDVREALTEDGVEVFELSVIGAVLRHCSILGCWLLGEPSFGRIRPVIRIVRALGLPEDFAKEFPDLYQFRLYLEERIASPGLSSNFRPFRWLERAEALVAKVEDLAHEQYCSMP